MSPATNPVSFGRFELDVPTGELRKDGLKIRLGEQPLQVLTILLEHPGQVVTREELQQRLWSSDTFVDFEHSLNAAVKRLREALGDSTDIPRYIETIPRHGYRLIIPVATTADEKKEKDDHRSSKSVSRLNLVAWLAITAAVIAGVVADRYTTKAVHVLTGSSPHGIHSIAVLPLENLSNDRSQEYFSDGITEVLITELSKVHSLRVVPRRSVMHYKGTTKTVKEIGSELHIDALVEGSALREGNKARISAQLIRVNPEEHLWAQNYERDLTDVITLQREITLTIVAELQVTLSPDEHTRIVASRLPHPSAQDDYFKGVYELEKFTPAGFENSIRLFQRATSIDPAYAMPHYGLAEAYISVTYASSVAPAEAFPKAETEAVRTLQLDPRLAEAHATLGWIKAVYYWDWVGAETEFKLALALNPNSVPTHRRYGWFLTWIGRGQQGMAEVTRASRLDPLNIVCLRTKGIVLYCQHKYDLALVEWNEAMKIDANIPIVNADLGRIYLQQGKLSDAVAQFEKARALAGGETGGSATGGGYLGLAYAAAGRKKDAIRIVDELLLRSQKKYVSPLNIAMIYMGLGDKTHAFQWLEKGYTVRDGDMVLLRVSPLWDPLRSDPRFDALLRRMNFPSTNEDTVSPPVRPT